MKAGRYDLENSLDAVWRPLVEIRGPPADTNSMVFCRTIRISGTSPPLSRVIFRSEGCVVTAEARARQELGSVLQ